MIAATSADATAKRKAAMESPPPARERQARSERFPFCDRPFPPRGGGFKTRPYNHFAVDATKSGARRGLHLRLDAGKRFGRVHIDERGLAVDRHLRDRLAVAPA